MLKGKTWKHLTIGVIIAVGALYFTFRKTDWSELLDTFSSAAWLPLLAVLPFLALSYIFRVYRWRVLLAPVSKVSFRSACPPLLIGFTVNSLLPGRIGEILRALLLSRKTDVPRAASFATVVLARLFDGLTLSALTLCVLGVMWNSLDTGVRTGLVAATLLYLVILLVLVLLRKWHERAARIIVSPLRWVRMHGAAVKMEGILVSFSKGLEVLKNPAEMIVVAVLSVCVWASLVISVIPVFLSLGLQFLWYYPILVLVLAGFGMLIPTPAGTGTVHYALGVLFPAVTGMEESSAKAMAILFHASQFLPIIVVGLITALREGVSTRTVEEITRGDSLGSTEN